MYSKYFNKFFFFFAVVKVYPYFLQLLLKIIRYYFMQKRSTYCWMSLDYLFYAIAKKFLKRIRERKIFSFIPFHVGLMASPLIEKVFPNSKHLFFIIWAKARLTLVFRFQICCNEANAFEDNNRLSKFFRAMILDADGCSLFIELLLQISVNKTGKPITKTNQNPDSQSNAFTLL